MWFLCRMWSYKCHMWQKRTLKMKIQQQTLTVTSTCLHLTAQLSVQAAVIIDLLITVDVNICALSATSVYTQRAWNVTCAFTQVDSGWKVLSVKRTTPLTPLGHIWDVVLVCVTVLCTVLWWTLYTYVLVLLFYRISICLYMYAVTVIFCAA